MKLFLFILFIPILAQAGEVNLIDEVNSYVSEQVKKECETCTFDVQFISPLVASENTENTENKKILSVTAPHWKGKTQISINTPKQTFSFPVEIRWFDNVVIAKQNIRHGKLIKERDVKLIKKDITFNQVAYLSDASKVVGLIGKRAFRRGQLIDENAIKMPRVVSHGQPLKLLFENGVLSMTVSGKAKGSGAVGDTIPVLISRTKKKVMAKIIDSTSARME